MPADLLIVDASLVATADAQRQEIPGGWVACTDGKISGVGERNDPYPAALRTISADGCLVTPGLINTHHHLFQNLTRAYTPMTSAPLFGWLQTLYPLWTAALDEQAAHVSTWVGLAELALSGCTTSTDHHYLHPQGAGDLLSAQIDAAARHRHALSPHLRLNEPVGQGRGAPARQRSARRESSFSPKANAP